jgi:putative NADH-flavin reductase
LDFEEDVMENNIIVLGAGGQIGSMVVQNLIEKNITPKAVIRNKNKEEKLKN